ncbi:conserved hypothetical protein [Gammaproteobacteria bacterium]
MRAQKKRRITNDWRWCASVFQAAKPGPPMGGDNNGRRVDTGEERSQGARDPLTPPINAYTIIVMNTKYTWQESKRQANLAKHQLDFIRAGLVLESPYRMDIETERNGECRQQFFAYVFDLLTVLTVVYLPGDTPHIISFRPAKRKERGAYPEWLANDFHDA